MPSILLLHGKGSDRYTGLKYLSFHYFTVTTPIIRCFLFHFSRLKFRIDFFDTHTFHFSFSFIKLCNIYWIQIALNSPFARIKSNIYCIRKYLLFYSLMVKDLNHARYSETIFSLIPGKTLKEILYTNTFQVSFSW